MFPAKAKSVIFLFMYGGPSHVDTFDYKPELYALDGKTIAGQDLRPRRQEERGPRRRAEVEVQAVRPVRQVGQRPVPATSATCVDDIAFIHSMTADSPIHGSAMLQMNTGQILSGSPCLGSWVNYGLGSENENLPGFVVMLDPTGGPISGAKNWSSGYMPAAYQGDDPARRPATPILDLELPDGHDATRCSARLLDTLQRVQRRAPRPRAPTTANLAARIASYELAFKMQQHAPEAVDLRQGDRRDQGAVRPRRAADRRLRPQVPAGPAAGRARRALHPALLRRRPQRRQLGRPRRPGRRTTPSTPARPTSRSPACSRT